MRGMRDNVALLGAMLAFGSMGGDMPFDTGDGRGRNRINPKKINTTPPKKVIPKGCLEYKFDDGFTCITSSQKVADKKHEKYFIHE
jgi:hypothetical protein